MDNSDDRANNSLEVLPDGIILLTQRGFQTGESVEQFRKPVDDLTDKLHQEGKKVHILVDMTAVTGHDAEARRLGEDSIDGKFDALAVCGQNTTINIVVNFMVSVKGLGDRVKLFTTHQQGLDWLHELQQKAN